MKRREMLKQTGLAAFAFATGCHNKESGLTDPVPNSSTDLNCQQTSHDMEGPYYPPELPDKTILYENEGQKVILKGRVLSNLCTPVSDGLIQIWHADQFGEYDLSNGIRRYTGQQSLVDGTFVFETLLPGAYANGPDSFRPKHFHIKIIIDGSAVLTTQLYFIDDDYLQYEPNLPDSRKMELTQDDTGALNGF